VDKEDVRVYIKRRRHWQIAASSVDVADARRKMVLVWEKTIFIHGRQD
jgi:hypothetical protein